MASGSLLFGAGFGVSALGVYAHSLPLLYAGELTTLVQKMVAFSFSLSRRLFFFFGVRGFARKRYNP